MITRKLNFKPSPDYTRMDMVLRRKGIPDRIPLFELFSNIEKDIVKLVYEPNPDIEKYFVNMDPMDEYYKNHIRYMYTLGYDYVNIFARNYEFPLKENAHTMTKEGERSYVNSESVTITGWDDYKTYKWPEMDKVDYSAFERCKSFIPEGMGVIAWASGILEYVMWQLGYEGISYMLSDDEEFVAKLFEEVGERMIQHYDKIASFDSVSALAMGEDMGFNTATMLSPEVYRKHLFPYHKRLVDAVHKHGKPIILHSCGNLSEIIDDVIACGWDAKHSFEDSIEPVWESQKKLSSRIALLGGFDMDKITRMSVEEVRKHTRFMMDTCGKVNGWAMGTGNSVPEYVPTENFLAMIEESFAKA